MKLFAPLRSMLPTALRQCVVGGGVALSLIFSATAGAQEAPSGDGLGVLQEFLPLDVPQHRLKIPNLDDSGVLKSVIESLTVTRVDDKNLRLEELVISMYTTTGEVEFVVKSPSAMFDTETKILSSDERTIITHDDFIMIGDGMLFNTETRQGKMTGNVTTEVLGGIKTRSNDASKSEENNDEE